MNFLTIVAIGFISISGLLKNNFLAVIILLIKGLNAKTFVTLFTSLMNFYFMFIAILIRSIWTDFMKILTEQDV